jgi:hypothetical protein
MSGFDGPGSAVGDSALKYTMLECNLLTGIWSQQEPIKELDESKQLKRSVQENQMKIK